MNSPSKRQSGHTPRHRQPRLLIGLGLSLFIVAPAFLSAASPASEQSGTVEVFANFAALSLNTKSDLTGTAVAVRKIAAWVAVANPGVASPIHKIRLYKWVCVDATKANCPDAHNPQLYYVSDEDYTAGYEVSLGVSYGVLAVPFKYHFSDHALTGGSTLGGYLGLTQDAGFTQISEVVGGGLALVSTTAATSNFTSTSSGSSTSAPSTSTLTGLSIVTGILGKIGNTNTQFGLLIGIDEVDNSARYKYNSKPWLSFSIGYNFSQ